MIRPAVSAGSGDTEMTRKLIVVPNDPVHAYVEKGLPDQTGYYNPLGYFDEVYDLAWHEPAVGELYGMQIEPTPPERFPQRVRELGADCIRAYDLYAGRYAARQRIPGVPLIVSVHDTNPARYAPGIPEADRFVAMSEAVRRRLIEYGAPENRIHVMPNRVDTEHFRPAEDGADFSDLAIRFPGRYRVLHVGRKSEEKNIETTLEALALLGEDYVGIFVGKGDEDAYRARAVELGIAKRCHWVQRVENADLPRWYNFADCFCTPSRWEGFGMVFLEALACGAPVVTADRPAMNEFVLDGQTGLLVEDAEDAAGIADRIAMLCTSASLRDRLRENGRKMALRYDKAVVDQMEVGHYSEVIAESRAISSLRGLTRPRACPQVSVVLPTYNQAQWLPDALNSIGAQTHEDWELIVVNDGSTDETATLLDRIDDPRVRVIHQKNQRLPAALNRGFSEARGKYLTWTSSDNLLAPRMLERLAGRLDEDPELGFVASHFTWIDETGRFLRLTSGQDLSPHALVALNPGIAAFMYRADLAEEVGDYDPALEGAEDWDMWVRLAARAPTALVPEILYHYRTHTESMTARIPDRVKRASAEVHRRALEQWGMRIDLRAGLRTLYPGLKTESDHALAEASCDFAARLIASPFGDAETAAMLLELSLATNPQTFALEVDLLAKLLSQKLKGDAAAGELARGFIRRDLGCAPGDARHLLAAAAPSDRSEDALTLAP
jgi:glycosyltransferase involved in cell wall biosynthesis